MRSKWNFFCLLLIMSVVLCIIHQALADCCYSSLIQCIDPDTKEKQIGWFCQDCSPPTPYCGKGDCNVFGCNCDGGCRLPNDTIGDSYYKYGFD